MTVGGDLYDHDPEPDRYQVPVPARQIKGAQREWAFWGAMMVLLWSAFQGQPLTALWFILVIIIVVTVKVITGPIADELRKTWNG